MKRYTRALFPLCFCCALMVLLGLSGCSQIASGDDSLDDGDEYIYTPTYVDRGWEFEEWTYEPYYDASMFKSLSYDTAICDSYIDRWGQYVKLNRVIKSTDSVNFYFKKTNSMRYLFSMDRDGEEAPLFKFMTNIKKTEYFVTAIEKGNRWYYPIDQEKISSEDDYIVFGLFNNDSSAYAGEVKNMSVFDNDKVWSLDFDVNLVVAGKFMGTKDGATVEELAEKILDRLNQALNPGGIKVRNINVLYAKDHPVVGSDYPETEPFIMSRLDDSAYVSRDQLSRWPGHEGEVMLVLGYYIIDESNSTMGFAPVPGTIYYDGSENYTNYAALATHYDSGATSAPSWEIANVAMHELGHYFGLKHTSEYGGEEFDDLEDTPECPRIGKRGTNSMFCPDYGYIMYPHESNKTYITFTPQQMDIIRLYLSTTPHK